MANINEIKKFEKEFQNSLKIENKLNINLKETKSFKTNLFENNFFSKELKEEKFIEITKDEILEIKGTGIVNIKIKFNSNLLINLQNKATTLIRIIVEKHVNVNLSEMTNNKKIYKYLQIYQKENSTVNFGQFILNSKINYSKTYLNKYSKYQINSGYFTNNHENFIRSEVSHLKGESNSNQNLSGASINKARTLCDGLINIKPQAKNSSGHLKISGLLLDKTSKILSEPILEVENNLVSCSHGCSISQISDDIEFYMMSRGISKNQIIELIVKSYFEIPLKLIKSEEQKKIIEKYLKFQL